MWSLADNELSTQLIYALDTAYHLHVSRNTELLDLMIQTGRTIREL